MTTIAINEIINARYIKITNNDPTNGYVIIPELEVYNFNDENVALNKATTASSIANHDGANLSEYMVDGNTNQVWGTGSGPGGVFVHTEKWESGDPEYVQVDLGGIINIKKIKVIQRTDWEDHINENLKIEIIDENSTVLKTESLNYINYIEYTYNQITLEITNMSVGSIENPSSTSIVTVEFSIAITDTEINSFITNEPSSGSTLSTMTTSDNGKTWTGTLTGTAGYVVKGATMSINYTGGINASDTYNIVMTADGKGWNEIFDITDGTNSYTGHATITCNKLGTMFATDFNQEKYDDANGIYPLVRVYEYDGTNWNQKGIDLAESTEGNRVHFAILNESGDHIIINLAPTDGTIVYKWDGSEWVQKGSVFTHATGWSGIPEITADGNMIGILPGGEEAWVYEYDTNTNDWVLKGNALDLNGFAGTGNGKLAINSEKTRIAFIKGTNIYTYTWNTGTSDWELVDTISVGITIYDLVSNYGGNRIAFLATPVNQTYKVEVYDWNGSGYTQVGTDIDYTGKFSTRLNLDETGNILGIGLRDSSNAWKTRIYKYDGSTWNLSKTFDHGKNIAISGTGERIFTSNGYEDKSVTVQEDSIIQKINNMIMTPSEIKFPETTSELSLEFSHKDLTSTEVETNVSISDVNLGSLGGFTSSEGGYVWTSTFTGANIEGSGTIDYSYSGMTGSVALIVDRLEKAISNICFMGEAKVLTSEGYMRIREVKGGMKVQGEEIEEVTRTKSKEKEVVLMKKGSIMKNMPKEDTVITKEHKVLYKGRMVEAKELVNGSSIVYEKYKGETLYNILLSGEGKMVVNGMIVETLSPSNNIAKLYKMLKGYKEEEKREIIKIYNEERKERSGKKQMK